MKFKDLDVGMQLKCTKAFDGCFCKNDVVTVYWIEKSRRAESGLIVMCRRDRWHAMEEFVTDNQGTIKFFERVLN